MNDYSHQFGNSVRNASTPAPSNDLSDSPSDGEQNRDPRSRRLIKATLRSPRFDSTSATIRDISNHGMGGKSPIELVAGEEITISAGRCTSHPATVRWYRNGNFGLFLEEPLDLKAFLFSGNTWDHSMVKEEDVDLVRTCYKPQKAYRPGFKARRD